MAQIITPNTPYSDAVKQIPAKPTHIGLTMDMTTIFGFISLIGPFFIMFMMFTLSIFNSNFKGFVYLIGVSVMYAFISVLNKTLISSAPMKNEYHFPYCQLFGSDTYQSIPSFNSALYIFTLAYLVLPMMHNNMFNLPLIIFFVLLFALDSVTRTSHINCTTGKGVSLGALIGFIWGVVYYNIIYQNDDTKQFLYYDDFESNKVACMRPSKQKFKCSVYKNGELVESI